MIARAPAVLALPAIVAAPCLARAFVIPLLFFGWLWGVWGLLLGAPLVAIAKVVCDRVESLEPAGALLGRWPAWRAAKTKARGRIAAAGPGTAGIRSRGGKGEAECPHP